MREVREIFTPVLLSLCSLFKYLNAEPVSQEQELNYTYSHQYLKVIQLQYVRHDDMG